MKASELRVGNWYNWYAEGKYYRFQVEPKDFKDENYLNFEPILLTEEWLERFGFERKEGRWTWIKIIYNEETTLPTTLQLWSGNDYVSVCRAGIGAMDCPCEHVHHLQNLYFALTGQELSVT